MSDFYKAIPLGNDIYRFTSVENVFFELLCGEEKAMVIDTGYGFDNVREAVRKLTDKPLVVVNTHGHVDHTCGNFWFEEEEIYISGEDMDLMRRHNTETMRRQSVELAKHAMDWTTGKEVYGLPEDFDPDRYIAGAARYPGIACERSEGPVKEQYHALTDGMVFDLGGKTIRVIATPGHTKGGMSFLYEEENWLYVGDEANVFLWLFDRDATSRSTHIATLDKILDLQPDRVYGGHGPDCYTMEDVKMFRRAAVEADYDAGIPFSTPLMPECKDIRICPLDGKTMEDLGKPGFYSILIDASRK